MLLRACIAAAAVLAVSGMCAAAQPRTSGEDSSTFAHSGFYFTVGPDAHHISTSLSGGVSGAFGVGVGYVILENLELQIEFLTGAENIPQDAHTPLWGRIPMGGASFDLRYFLSTGQALHPFVLVGYDLSSLIDDDTHGYSGGGPRGALGLQLECSSAWAVSAQVGYAFIRYYSVVSDTDPAGIFQAFTDHRLGVAVHVNFYPNLLP